MNRGTLVRHMKSDDWSKLEREVTLCANCPRLASWRVEARDKAPRAWRGTEYWSKPVPGFGDTLARLVIVGLAPGAHGANRTGRPFTGDGAGPFLYGALRRAGYSNQDVPLSRDDGLRLRGARITNAVRCAPPGNLPTPEEFERCAPLLARELELCKQRRVVLCLGGHAWKSVLAWLRARGSSVPRPAPKFGHGAEFESDGLVVLGAFHPSQLNTRTGRLTPTMFDAVLARARAVGA